MRQKPRKDTMLVSTKTLISLFRDSEMRMMEYIDRKLDQKLKDHTAELKSYVESENRKQTEEICDVIRESNTASERNFVSREEFEKRVTTLHSHQ